MTCLIKKENVSPTFNGIERKSNVYRVEDCMKRFYESLRNQAMKKINFEKKKMIPLTNEQKQCATFAEKR